MTRDALFAPFEVIEGDPAVAVAERDRACDRQVADDDGFDEAPSSLLLRVLGLAEHAVRLRLARGP